MSSPWSGTATRRDADRSHSKLGGSRPARRSVKPDKGYCRLDSVRDFWFGFPSMLLLFTVARGR
ncbi:MULTISPECIES: hypothetical protein [unclassified Actinoplanes]|uniref:hypothetical protein n=1 Tax=unclassified Actinoplanes TaxID=2626549 RepID=UPI0002E43962|nr:MULTISPECIES: hypothetical protein [unclassified Actinoplanes]